MNIKVKVFHVRNLRCKISKINMKASYVRYWIYQDSSEALKIIKSKSNQRQKRSRSKRLMLGFEDQDQPVQSGGSQ